MVDNNDILKANTDVIQQEITWFEEVLSTRLKLYFGHESPYQSVWEIASPVYEKEDAYYANFIHHYHATNAERIVLMLALVPHICLEKCHL
jgi:hypothetical protein